MTSPARQAFDEVLGEMREYAVHNRSAWDVLHDWADRLSATHSAPPGDLGMNTKVTCPVCDSSFLAPPPPVDVAEVERVAIELEHWAYSSNTKDWPDPRALGRRLIAALSAGGVSE